MSTQELSKEAAIYAEACHDVHDHAYKEGKKAGYYEGYDKGFLAGYQIGLHDARDVAQKVQG